MTGAQRTSRITGKRQVIGLRLISGTAALGAALGIFITGPIGVFAGTTAVAAVIAAPLLRVGWLIVRWWQERDLRFVGIGLGVLIVITAGAALALMGVG